MSDIDNAIKTHAELGARICTALTAEIEKLALEAEIPPPAWEDAHFNLVRDPALGDESLEALWLNERGAKLGSATIHGDGNFFAEYDIIRTHPKKPRWFIEAVSVWGKGETVKSEARLLPMPE
jgi:hypothetical protein